MELSTRINSPGWVAVVASAGLAVILAFSCVILVSFGGQVIVAPALLPVQWLVARATSGWVSRTFAVLGGLLLLEVVPLGGAVLLGGDGAIVWIAGFVVAIAGAAAFYRTSQDGT